MTLSTNTGRSRKGTTMSENDVTVMSLLEGLRETAFKDIPVEAQDSAIAAIMFFLIAS